MNKKEARRRAKRVSGTIFRQTHGARDDAEAGRWLMEKRENRKQGAESTF